MKLFHIRGLSTYIVLGALLVGLFGQTLVIWLVVYDYSGDRNTLWATFIASWIVAGVSTLFVWVATAGTDDAVTTTLLRRARRRPLRLKHPSDRAAPGWPSTSRDSGSLAFPMRPSTTHSE